MKTVLNLKIDKTLKTEAQLVAEGFGIPLGTIVNALLRQFVRTKEISLNMSYEPTPFLQSVIRESEIETAKDNKNGDSPLEGKNFIKKLKKL
ncbi:MAG: type II toxin-antitoxin system RelB/DinJ family antitoxin [Candidatus Pacebacteria bacterium]|nr:type II toxin-antitoxin system RelB/DinJ family antitoxin [Candidatus Paceibacterota bacterium]